MTKAHGTSTTKSAWTQDPMRQIALTFGSLGGPLSMDDRINRGTFSEKDHGP